MKRAAYRREAAWEYPLSEEPPFLILLPDVQGLRQWLGRGLSGKIRYHLSRGELDQAREGILVGLANAKHISTTPFLVNQLVANAIHRIMLDRVGELISQPDSPNLYWALSMLPESLVELGRAADFEGSAFLLTFPAAADLNRPRDAAEWKKMLQQWHELNRYLNLASPDKIKEAEENLTDSSSSPAASCRAWPGCRPSRSPPCPTRKPPSAGSYTCGLSRDQQEAAALHLPPREALPRLKQMRAEKAAIEAKVGAARIELRDPTAGYVALWSLRRKIAALRIIEAVRHHLAVAGKLPANLADIADMTLPLDPLTDQSFVWKVDGHQATLSAPELARRSRAARSDGPAPGFLEYRLEAKPKANSPHGRLANGWLRRGGGSWRQAGWRVSGGGPGDVGDGKQPDRARLSDERRGLATGCRAKACGPGRRRCAAWPGGASRTGPPALATSTPGTVGSASPTSDSVRSFRRKRIASC